MNKTEIEIQKVLEEFRNKWSNLHDRFDNGVAITAQKYVEDFLSQALHRVVANMEKEHQEELKKLNEACNTESNDREFHWQKECQDAYKQGLEEGSRNAK